MAKDSAPYTIEPHPFRNVTIGFCAISAREPSQGRKAAALSGITDVPQVA